VQLGDVRLKITEATIAEAMGLPMVGERYFKRVIVDKNICQQFLKLEHHDVDWTKGVPRSYIKEKHCTMLISLHKLLTCEGRYVVTFIYHLNLLSHFEGGPQINFPHFLWMSLMKMARGVRSVSKKPETSLHHHGSIKIMVVHAPKTQGGSWKWLLQQSFTRDKAKSVETQKAGTYGEISSRKAKKDVALGRKEDTIVPNYSHLMEKSVT
jgi:hypothetical protein